MKGFDTSNLEQSERVIAAIMLRLAETGFQHSRLRFENLNLSADLEKFFDVSVVWLMDEGIVRSASFSRSVDGPSTLYEPALTSKGLGLFGQRFLVREDTRDTGEAVAAIAKGDRSLWQIGDLVGSIIGGFTKSLGG